MLREVASRSSRSILAVDRSMIDLRRSKIDVDIEDRTRRRPRPSTSTASPV
jgi:hypothetical protein